MFGRYPAIHVTPAGLVIGFVTDTSKAKRREDQHQKQAHSAARDVHRQCYWQDRPGFRQDLASPSVTGLKNVRPIVFWKGIQLGEIKMLLRAAAAAPPEPPSGGILHPSVECSKGVGRLKALSFIVMKPS